jgi:nucleotide-binding universal stress UspA family protein
MKSIKRIIAGIDSSKYAANVMKHAGSIASRHSAEILAVSVIDKGQLFHIEEISKYERSCKINLTKFINDEKERRIRRIQELFRTYVPEGVQASSVICVGVPFEEILKKVDEKEADLVVISSKGRTNFQDYMFGTTSEKIFRHCPVTLLSLNIR